MNAYPKQAMVLAAGLGTRLRPLTLQVPKPALPVGGVPLLFFNLYLLKKAGIREVLINLHHQPAPLKSLLKNFSKLGLKLEWSFEKSILGTAGGIAHALPKLKEENLLILNGDVISDVDLKKMFKLHQRMQAKATLAVIAPHYASVKNFVEFDGKGQIYKIARAPKRQVSQPLHKGIFSGIQMMHRSLIEKFPPNQFGCVIRQIYQPLLERKEKLMAFQHKGHWWDLGSLDTLTEVDQKLWSGQVAQNLQKTWREVYAWSAPVFTPQS